MRNSPESGMMGDGIADAVRMSLRSRMSSRKSKQQDDGEGVRPNVYPRHNR